ncbi:hypothetical protein OIO90_003528 [Microbotryomycetes sp. JL221]|nr:hypothetical protein OIO90_003528 [Microbotryomycetes sp. JL221]
MATSALEFEVLARCSTTLARVSRMRLPHSTTMLPTFMPVATQASLKGTTPLQIMSIEPTISLILNNTYHLSLRPGTDILDGCGGSHEFQNWPRNLLTDSGGFQMVSLVKLSKVTEQGVMFANPYDPNIKSMLTPERSMQIQHSIGADIMMQLDDVVSSLTTGERMQEAMHRSVRWLDRCLDEHEKSGRASKQNLFAIVQGGLDPTLRNQCLDQMLEPQRESKIPGYAIGGLSGGEEKDYFWKIVKQCAERLPQNKPRYCMGIGYGEDLLVCAALGVDMADCVFPTRTARFGVALTFSGPINLRQKQFNQDYNVIDSNCNCTTCDRGQGLSKSQLHVLAGKETSGANAITLHNLTYQSTLMSKARAAILKDEFPQYLINFFAKFFGSKDQYPSWAVDALQSVGVDLLTGEPDFTKDWNE